jgi:hypothetical protein
MAVAGRSADGLLGDVRGEDLTEVGAEGVKEDILHWQGSQLVAIQRAAALGAADVAPIGGPIVLLTTRDGSEQGGRLTEVNAKWVA